MAERGRPGPGARRSARCPIHSVPEGAPQPLKHTLCHPDAASPRTPRPTKIRTPREQLDSLHTQELQGWLISVLEDHRRQIAAGMCSPMLIVVDESVVSVFMDPFTCPFTGLSCLRFLM